MPHAGARSAYHGAQRRQTGQASLASENDSGKRPAACAGPPASSGDYAAQALDAGSVPLYSTYTVTFYDKNGAQLGQASVINLGSPLGAAAGGSVAWPSLAMNDATTQFLTPGTQLATAQYALSVTWSSLINGINLAYPVTSAQIQATVQTTAGLEAVDGFSSASRTTRRWGNIRRPSARAWMHRARRVARTARSRRWPRAARGLSISAAAGTAPRSTTLRSTTTDN